MGWGRGAASCAAAGPRAAPLAPLAARFAELELGAAEGAACASVCREPVHYCGSGYPLPIGSSRPPCSPFLSPFYSLSRSLSEPQRWKGGLGQKQCSLFVEPTCPAPAAHENNNINTKQNKKWGLHRYGSARVRSDEHFPQPLRASVGEGLTLYMQSHALKSLKKLIPHNKFKFCEYRIIVIQKV